MKRDAGGSPNESRPAPGAEVGMGRGPASWKRLRRVLARLRRWSHKSRDERRSGAARARFWAEARAGEREAEARVRN